MTAHKETSCCAPAKPKFALVAQLKRLLSPWTAIVLVPILVWLLAPNDLLTFLDIASSALLGTLPFIVFAVLLIAAIKASGAEVLVARAFSGRENKMIVVAAVFGGLAPFCSCEVIPFIAGLLAVGTPLPAVMAFWLASPLIDPAALVITAGALGWPFAVGKALIAIMLGLFGGFALKLLMHTSAFKEPLRQRSTSSCRTTLSTNELKWQFWQQAPRRQVFRHQAAENMVFLLKWLTFAYILEGLLILYIPAETIGQLVGGDGLWAVIVGAAVGMPAYLNGYAAPALVAGFVEQGMSAGAAMAFMTAGAISSIPAMAAVWSLVKKPVFAAYIMFGFSGAVMLGWLFGLLAG